MSGVNHAAHPRWRVLGRRGSPVPDPRPDAPLVDLINVSRRFGDVIAVQDVCLSLRPGEFTTLLGPSGCGKTTTLRMIAGFERPSGGSIQILGRDVTDVPPNRRPVNTVFQSYALFAHLNVHDNVAFGLKEAHLPRREIE